MRYRIRHRENQHDAHTTFALHQHLGSAWHSYVFPLDQKLFSRIKI